MDTATVRRCSLLFRNRHLIGSCMADFEIDSNGGYAVDLTSCDREPIHHIGAVQSIGFLIAISPDWLISHVSANAAAHLGLETAKLLGTPLRDVIRAEA